MGSYVNPPSQPKEQFLEEHGFVLPQEARFSDAPKDHMIVVLVQNPLFSAAGICFDEQEFARFMDPRDVRPKKLFAVPISDLLPVSDLKQYLK